MNYFLKLLLIMLFLPLTIVANSISFENRQDFYMVNQNSSNYDIFSFSVQKNKFLTGRDNDHLLLWNIETGLPIKDFGKMDYVYHIKKSKDNHYILIHSILDYNDSIRVLDTQKEEIYTIDSKSQVEGSSYLTDMGRDGKYLIFTEGDCKQSIIKVFDIEQKRVIKTFSTHGQDLYDIKLSPKNSFIATMSRDDIFTLWTIKGKKIFKIKFPETKEYHRYYDLEISPDEKYILVGESIFDINKNKFIKKFNSKFISLHFTENNNEVIFHTKRDRNITFWDINKSKISSYFSDKESKIIAVKKINNTDYFEYQIDKKHKNKLFNAKTHQEFFEFNRSIGKYTISDIQNSIMWHDDDMLHLYDFKKQKDIKSFGIEKVVNLSSVVISKDAKYIASASSDTIAIWDVENNKLLHLITKEDIDSPLTFNSTGEYLMIFSNAMLKIFDTKKGTLLKSIKVSDEKYLSFDELYLTFNDRYLVLKKYDDTTVWDFKKSKFIKSNFVIPTSNRRMFSHEDRYIITLVDNRIKLYDMNDIETPIKEFVLGNKNSWVVFDYKNKKIYKEGDGKFLFKRKYISPLSKYSLELIP